MVGDIDLGPVRIRQLQYLVEVARVGQFGDAADQLGVTQSAISQGLARLAEQLGIDLFEADGRYRRLSPAGESVAAAAAELLAEARSLERDISERVSGSAGLLRVGMIDAAVLYLLPAAIDRFRDEGGSLEIAVASSEQLVARVRDFTLDLAFVVGPEPDLRTVELTAESLHVYESRTAQSDKWVLYPSGSRTRAVIERALSGPPLTAIAGESGNPAVLAQLSSLGMGSTVLPKRVGSMNPDLRQSRKPLANRQVVGCMRAGSESDRLIERFVELALAEQS
jgi:DNA-binding transcriptional LysR family regulator